MQPRTKGLVAAVTGSALGITGLAVIALPAGAGEAPTLPEISAEELVESTLKADAPAFAGKVEVDNDLGLPRLPGMELADFESAQVYHDGDERARLGVQDGTGEFTVVKDAKGVWTYNSAKNTATRYTVPADAAHSKRLPQGKTELSDPSSAATQIIDRLSETSTISVDGTARVAGRPAYELVLTPKPSERTLLREVKVAIDSATRVPLRFEMLPNGSPEPVLSIGFSEFTVGDQPDELFTFTPPRNAKVVTEDGSKHRDKAKEHETAAREFGEGIKVVGEGWDMVVTGSLPKDALSGGSDEQGADPQALLERFGKKVSGDFGTGYLITTRAGTGLVTDDGRFAAGAVPQQVLEDALEQK